MENIRVIFFGTPEFAANILEMLCIEKYNVVCVVSQPDRRVGRKQILEETPVHKTADQYGIPVLQPVKIRESCEDVLSYSPDLIVTCAYGQIVPDAILAAPKFGCINVHPSDLPKYRGGAPIQRAVWNGDEKTAVCVMEMVHKMDAGQVFAREYVDIPSNATGSDMFEILGEVSCRVLKEMLPKYIAGEITGEPQDESKVVYAPNISREEEQVHFQTETTDQVFNHIRALLKEPAGYGMLEGKRVKFLGVKRLEHARGNVGEILGFENGAMLISCKDGVIGITDLQMEGKKPMSADAFKNGAKNLIGKCFE